MAPTLARYAKPNVYQAGVYSDPGPLCEGCAQGHGIGPTLCLGARRASPDLSRMIRWDEVVTTLLLYRASQAPIERSLAVVS